MPHTLICLHVDVKCTDVFELKFAVKFFSFKVKCVIALMLILSFLMYMEFFFFLCISCFSKSKATGLVSVL